MRPALADGLPLAPDGSGLTCIDLRQCRFSGVDGCATCPNKPRGGPCGPPRGTHWREVLRNYQVEFAQPPLAGATWAAVHVRVSTPLFSTSVNTSPVCTTLEVSV